MEQVHENLEEMKIMINDGESLKEYIDRIRETLVNAPENIKYTFYFPSGASLKLKGGTQITGDKEVIDFLEGKAVMNPNPELDIIVAQGDTKTQVEGLL